MSVKGLCTGLQHIGVPTKCMEDTIAFYKKLGFEIASEGSFRDGRVVFLKLGDLVIEAYEAEETAGQPGAIDHIALNVTDIEKMLDYVNEQGLNNTDAQIESLPFWDNGVSFFTIQGPNQEKVEFNQYL